MDLGELKRMMEKLGVPQTHLALKTMIKEVDEDDDDKISFREVRDIILLKHFRVPILRYFINDDNNNNNKIII